LSCLYLYAKRYAALLLEIRADLQEFLATGTISRARQLTGRPALQHRPPPTVLHRRPQRAVVLVHLNPKQATIPMPPPGWQATVRTLEDYFNWYRHFGARMYGPSSPRTHRSPFDHKQLRFLRPLHVIDFVQERTGDDRFTNLERMIDHKLQLELVPYGSASFSTHGFTPAVLEPHFDRILSTMAAVPRRYVLFCGAVFRPLLSEHVTAWHEFYLRKKDGTPTRQRASFANLLVPHNGGWIRAGLAQSWARQGIPMAAYAAEVRSRYEDDAAQ
jgi:hypothetical protein